MADMPLGDTTRVVRQKRPGLMTRLALSPRFHALVERLPFIRRHAHAEGRALFAIVSGFVRSQVLMALVELRILNVLSEGPSEISVLARRSRMPEDRLAVLLRAGAGLRLIRQDRRGLWHLTTRGAAFLTVPGLDSMVRHHDVLYRDMADPAAFFRGETVPELAGFWPYVFGGLADRDTELAARYSRLMSDSQALVAADTLRAVNLTDRKRLMDVGGGTGAFLAAVQKRYPGLALTLFDLPEVVEASRCHLPGVSVIGGSFREEALPLGADAISLVRVLYDHPDDLVRKLADSAFQALPKGGLLIVSEPMSGGDRPDPDTDVYFAVYTMAMHTGRTRSIREISQILESAGFVDVKPCASARPFITSVVVATRP